MIFRKAASLPLFLLLSACGGGQPIRSQDLSPEARLEELRKAIVLKSDIISAEFVLLDANRSSSVPGASGKSYKIFLKLKATNVRRWTAGKDDWITSFPKDRSWVHDVIRDPALLHEIETAQYSTYYKSEQGYDYTLWADYEKGFLLIRYLQN
ncbi:MAG: hypothetical protein JNM27_16150 [Leptospirales bacterium]|nr:hypothetical protein [Leptospirales bacterium]